MTRFYPISLPDSLIYFTLLRIVKGAV
uniref:Uncharacterized protein n=1 Tax=Anguilla anguilla TaxID=7936 RepID=A0A0E9QAY7_ANGAN